MGVQVTFDYGAWIARYPEFAGVDQGTAQLYFNEATLYCRNDGGGPVDDATTQATLLNMLTSHVAKLNAPKPTGEDASPLVGRIAGASQGSVNVSVENQYPPGSPQWYQQTKYGAAFWAASAVHRTLRYFRPHSRRFNPWPFG